MLNVLNGLVGHFHFIFWELPAHSISPLIEWVVWFPTVSLNPLYILAASVRCVASKDFLVFWRLPLRLSVTFAAQKLCDFVFSHLSVPGLLSWAGKVLSGSLCLHLDRAMFPPSTSGFRPCIKVFTPFWIDACAKLHSSAYGELRFLRYHLLIEPVFSTVYVFAIFVKHGVAVAAWVSIRVSIPLHQSACHAVVTTTIPKAQQYQEWWGLFFFLPQNYFFKLSKYWKNILWRYQRVL